MAVYQSPAGLSATPTANQLSEMVTFKEGLCKGYCVLGSQQAVGAVTYTVGTAKVVTTQAGSSLHIPVTAQVSIQRPGNGCGCSPNPDVYTERFTIPFAGVTALPTDIQIVSLGTDQGPTDVCKGVAKGYVINDVIQVTITPAG